MTREFQAKLDSKEFYRPDVFVDLWRCVTKIRLVSRLEEAPPSIGVMKFAESLNMAPEKVLNLSNVGEWIQVDRDTRHWDDEDEYEEYWLCHYDGDQTVEGYTQLRNELKEIKELNTLWKM